MQGMILRFWRILTPIILILSLILLFVPSALSALAAHPSRSHVSLIGPAASYLALGDSLAFGYQPDLDFLHGYTDYFSSDLKMHGTKNYVDLACPDETSTTLIKGGCPKPLLHKYIYAGSQLNFAVDYLHQHAGQVSPVTLNIGANDLLPDFTTSNCSVNARLSKDLATLNTNLTSVILPQLLTALTVNGQVTGDILLLDNYDPYQDICPNSKAYIQEINRSLSQDVQAFKHVMLVDIYHTFADAGGDNPAICRDTWICSTFKDVHSTDTGYQKIAQALESATGY